MGNCIGMQVFYHNSLSLSFFLQTIVLLHVEIWSHNVDIDYGLIELERET